MSKDQFPPNSPEWTALTKLDVARYEAATAQEMAAYRPACLQAQTEESQP